MRLLFVARTSNCVAESLCPMRPLSSPRSLRLHVALPLGMMLAIGASVFALHSYAPLQLAMLIPITYGLIVFSYGALKYNRPDPALSAARVSDDDLPFVSVLIPAHNEEFVIGNTLNHVLRMDYPRFEVIVIDDHSSDNTSDVVRGFPGVKLIQRRHLPNRGKSEALNTGLEFAQGDVLCVFDADSEMAPNFLREAVLPLVADTGIAGTQAQVRIYNRRENLLTASQDAEFALYNEIVQIARTRWALGAALGGNGQLTRRSAMEAVGGWNPGSLTEDLDLTVRLWLAGQGRIYHVTSAIVWQEGVTTFKGLIRQRQRWAEGMLRTYADFAGHLLRDRNLTLRLRLDGFYALFSAFLPFLTLIGLIVQAASWAPGVIVHSLPQPIGNFMTYAVLGFAVTWSVVISWRRDRRIDVMPGLLYLVYLLHWVPALMIAVRNVFGGRAVVWAKTEHRGHATLPALPGTAAPVAPLTAQPVGAGRES